MCGHVRDTYGFPSALPEENLDSSDGEDLLVIPMNLPLLFQLPFFDM